MTAIDCTPIVGHKNVGIFATQKSMISVVNQKTYLNFQKTDEKGKH